MSKISRSVVNGIDWLNHLIGELGKWILMIMVFSLMFEVIARYFFEAPTIWVTDVCEQCMILLGSVGGAYSYLYDQFVRVDLFYEKLSLKHRALVDILTFSIFALFMYMVVTTNLDALEAASAMNASSPTVLRIPYSWGRTAILVGSILLALQGISILIKNIYVLRYNEPYPAKYK
jgi:TRAP-type mannitol/chloroaromatic compound transport system permease small subunit